jgi:hypothetical protein
VYPHRKGSRLLVPSEKLRYHYMLKNFVPWN